MTDPTFWPPGNLGGPAVTPPSKMGGSEKSTLGCLAIFLAPIALIVLVLIVGAIWTGVSGGSKDEPYDPNWSGEAITQCEDLVKESLKAPSTAEFDSSASGFGTWTVTGTVDSENSFGAMLRSEFQCTVVVSGDSIKRRLDYLE